LALLRDAWEHFGFEEAFADVPQARQRRLLQAMIFGRILFGQVTGRGFADTAGANAS